MKQPSNRSYGKPLPAKLHLTLVEIEAGRSSQATLLGRDEMTVESLYLSPALAEELEARPTLQSQDSKFHSLLKISSPEC